MKKSFLTILMIVGGFMLLQAQQKFGHMNSSVLLTEMDEIKSANSQLETYQKQLMSKGQKMLTDLQAKVNKYQQEYQAGTLSALQAQQKETEINTERQALQEYEVEMQELIGKKREELYKPLLDKVKVAIEKIGKANGYTMIFDSSVPGAIVHAQDSDDVTALVKAELGIQ